MRNLDALKNFDWRSLKKYTSAQASEDLNAFLEKLPQNTSQTLLVITGIAWAAAAALGLFTTVKLQALTELRAQLQEMEAVQPSVPIVRDVSVSKEAVAAFVESTKKIYPNLEIKANNTNVMIEGQNTAFFAQFREAIGHVQNGGQDWKVTVDRLCVGRECQRNALAAVLKINKVSVDKPS